MANCSVQALPTQLKFTHHHHATETSCGRQANSNPNATHKNKKIVYKRKTRTTQHYVNNPDAEPVVPHKRPSYTSCSNNEAVTPEEHPAVKRAKLEVDEDDDVLERKREQACIINNNEVALDDSTVMFLDWDDTLLPSSWLLLQHLSVYDKFIPDQDRAQLDALDNANLAFFKKATSLCGRVLLVTNGQQGWIEMSSKKFLPQTHKLLFEDPDCQIVVQSARALYEEYHPTSPAQWKLSAFKDLLQQYLPKECFREDLKVASTDVDTDSCSAGSVSDLLEGFDGDVDCNASFASLPSIRTVDLNMIELPSEDVVEQRVRCNIITIGDNVHDCDAAKNVDLEMVNPIVKTVKLLGRPEIGQLLKQIEWMTEEMQKLVEHESDVDLEMDPSDLDPEDQ